MDMLATLAENPLYPAAWEPAAPPPARVPDGHFWAVDEGGIVEIGHDGAGFAFDSEGPRHKVMVHPHGLADRPVTNAEWLGFIEAGGYAEPRLWLSDGWAWVQAQAIEAPLYWSGEDGTWSRFGLDGLRPLNLAEPVCHVSYYEADAYARWSERAADRGEGRAPPPATIPMPVTSSTRLARPARVRRPRGRASATSSATSGNGPPAPSFPTPASVPPKARSASIMASSWARRWCCAAAVARHRAVTCAPHTAISSIRISAGCSPA